jgi:hypothetical protein
METFIALLIAAVGLGYIAAYISIRQLRRAVKLQPLLGVVSPKTSQDASESIKTVKKVK